MTRQESILALGKETCRAAEGEEALLGLLCTAAEGAWTGRLRPGVRPEDCEETLRCACAFTAAAGILRSRGSGTPGFTAGSVSVRAGGAGETEGAARALEAQAEALMVPWCGEADFAFQGVRG